MFLIDVETAGYPGLFAGYVLRGFKTTIIDPGPSLSVSNLLLGLRELGIQPESVAYVALSHVHIDHSGCAGALLRSLPNAKVIVHPRGAPHLVNPDKLWASSQVMLGQIAEVFGKPEPVPEERIISATDGMEFEVGRGVRLEAVETLGHAAHHLSFYDSSSGVLFPGDAAGIYFEDFDVVVPTSPPPFYPGAALDSLQRLLSFNPKTLCYTHFGKADQAVCRLTESCAADQVVAQDRGRRHKERRECRCYSRENFCRRQDGKQDCFVLEVASDPQGDSVREQL